MPLSDILVAALSRPAGRVVDSPVRAIVAEVLADHGYASPAEVAALQTEVTALRGKVSAFAGRMDALEAGLAAAREETGTLRAALDRAHEDARVAREAAAEALARATAPAPAPVPAPVVAAPVAMAAEPSATDAAAEGCKVAGCAGAAHAQGFCRAHHHLWRAGRLAGFVGPEGLLEMEGKAARVALDLAGQPYKISEKDGRLRVAGRFASATAL